MINFFDIIAMTLMILKWYGLIEINGWWILMWFFFGFLESLITIFVKEVRND